MSGPVLMQGNMACALAAVKAGCDFFGGYPITPSTEIAEYMAEQLPKINGRFMQMEDEIASIGAIIGASAVGHKSFTATSGPGFSLMQELLGYACNCEIPLVIANVMRFGPSTGLPTLPAAHDVMQARWGTHGDHAIIAISPASVGETYTETVRAFNLAQIYRTPVILLMDEKIGHLREGVDLSSLDIPEPVPVRKDAPDNFVPFEGRENMVPELVPLGYGKRYHMTGLTHNKEGFYSQDPVVVEDFITRINGKIENSKKDICKYEKFMTEDADIVIVAYGSVARSCKEVVAKLRANGIKAGLFRLITIWPFDDDAVYDACKNSQMVFMPEMNLGQLSGEVGRAVKNIPFGTYFCANGDLMSPSDIVEKIIDCAKERGIVL